MLTKHVSCVFRAFWDATRTVTVWAISVLLGLESLSWQGSPIQLAGFVFLVVGNLTYNEVIEWKFWGINKYMSKYDVTVRRKSVKTRESVLQAALHKESVKKSVLVTPEE